LLATALLWARASVSEGAQRAEKVIKGLGDSYILKSEDREHAILHAACKSCHKDEEYDFWMIVYGEKEPHIEVEIEKGIFGKDFAGRTALPGFAESGRKGNWDFPNSHDYFDCEFCHLGEPNENAERPEFTTSLRDLCIPCHPNKKQLHLYEGDNSSDKVKLDKLLKHNLPTEDGKVRCLTCHQVHNAIYSVRPAYIKAEVSERRVDPHGAELYCLLCHEGTFDNPAAVIIRKKGDTIPLCGDCHDVERSGSEHHPVDVAIGEETWKLGFINFPFPEGKMSCATCHDEVCYLPRDPANKLFLRGGPYSLESEFCFRCHAENKATALNPHDQFHDVGLLKVDTCYACHTSVPDVDGGSAEASDLIDEEVFLCQKCHGEEMPHPVVNHLLPITHEMLDTKTDYEAKHMVSLPLGEQGAIVCTTCHNPHDKGVLKGEKGAGAGELHYLRLPDYNENCSPCHGDKR
jgi:hypothetical protein